MRFAARVKKEEKEADGRRERVGIENEKKNAVHFFLLTFYSKSGKIRSVDFFHRHLERYQTFFGTI